MPLREFSNWLADFDPATFKIEIPGQYAQAINRAPVVANHAMIGMMCYILLFIWFDFVSTSSYDGKMAEILWTPFDFSD